MTRGTVPRPRSGPALPSPLTTRELSVETWPDFERLFEQYGGVQAGCWCMFYHRVHPPEEPIGPKRSSRNRTDHRVLVHAGQAHGVLVYCDGKAVGWCQFGTRDELPRIDRGRIYRGLGLPKTRRTSWRITCFFVNRSMRRRGVAGVALHAAIGAIRRMGGGVVEAYPSTHGRAVAVWFGTVSMFEAEGFHQVASLGRSNVVVRRLVGVGRRSPNSSVKRR